MEGITIRKVWIILLSLSVLTACSEKGVKIENETSQEEEQLENMLKKNEHVKYAVALMHDQDLMVGIRVNTFSRFQKKKIAREIEKKLEKKYPNLNVTVSADSKLLLETEKMINKESEKNYGKRVKELKSLIKEET